MQLPPNIPMVKDGMNTAHAPGEGWGGVRVGGYLVDEYQRSHNSLIDIHSVASHPECTHVHVSYTSTKGRLFQYFHVKNPFE